MGNYDIFKSTLNEETNEWSSPTNIGYPINTPIDDYNICFTNDKKCGIVSIYQEIYVKIAHECVI